jgi:hypothetical protein
MREALDHLRKPSHPVNRVLVLLFLIAVFAPLAATVATLSRSTDDDPKRESAPWPPPPSGVTDLARWTSGFRAWFADHYAFRRELIRIQGGLLLKGLGVSPSRTVLVGKDGWWYYTDDDAMEDIVSATPMPEFALATWSATIEANRKWLSGRGIPYLFVLAPDKHAVYPEFLPDSVRVLNASRLDQLGARLQEHSSLDVLNLRPVLSERKRTERVYHRTDTHWNPRGALVAWLAIAEWMERSHPGFRAPTREDYSLFSWTGSGQDLPRMLGLSHLLTEDVLDVRPKRSPAYRVVEPADVDPGVETGRLVTEHPDATLPKLVVFRDSFATALIPHLSDYSRRCVYLWQKDLDPEVVRQEKPDLVIHEIVGRRLQSYLPYNAVADFPAVVK